MSVRSHPKKKRSTPSPEAEKHKETILKLHSENNSTRKIAETTGLSKTYVAKLLKDWGLSRSKQEALNIYNENRTPVDHWRLNRARARKLYQKYHNVILPSDVHVHHINGNSYDNSIENLQALPASVHLRLKRVSTTWAERNPERCKINHRNWRNRPEVKERLKRYKQEIKDGLRIPKKNGKQ